MAIDPKRVKEIFLEAAELSDEAARAAYLDRACAGDAGLRARVEALLRSHDPEGSFLGTPAAAAPDPAHAATQDLSPDPASVVAAAQTAGGENGPSHDEALAFLAPPTRPDALGRLGHYEVLQVLGRGGFGIVFRAFDEMLQRVVALKVMAPQLAATSPARKRFLREARSSAQVRHENVVQVYEVAEQPLPYLAMEFIPGETLQQKLDRVGPLDVPEVLRIGRQIAEGLAAAHATDLIHRDVKPGNVLLEGGQHKVKITDFGLARAADDASITQSGIIAGTPMYMAPEQAQGQMLDQRADLFSLGSVLYQMVAGRPPFRANTTVAVLKRVADDQPRAIREIIPETPQWLCDVIAKLHAKDPDDRYQSAREVADVLADCEAQLKAHAKIKDFSRIPRGKPRRSGRWKWATAALVLLALAGVGLFALTRPRPNSGGPGTEPPRSAAVTWGEVTDPLGDCRFTEENGRLTITVPGDRLHDLNPLPGCNLNSPRVLREVAGDFEARVTVLPYPRPTSLDSTGPHPSYVGAGLVVWSDEANFLRLFRAYSGGSFVTPEWYNGLALGGQNWIPVPDGPMHLRIRRTGDTLHLASSTDGQTWTEAATANNLRPASPVRVGVAVVNAIKQEFTVQFEGFEIKELPPSSLPPSVGTGSGPMNKPAAPAIAPFTDPDRRAAEYVLSIGGSVRINDENEDRNAAALPPGTFRLTTADLRNHQEVTDAGLANFKGCKDLKFLSLYSARQVSDAGLASFKDCKDLVAIDIGQTQLTDAGLAYFKDCKNLTILGLTDTQVSDAGLAYFKDRKDLMHLYLNGATQVSDAGLAHFKDCKNLTNLALDHTQVGDAGLAYFKGAPLSVLMIDNTGITDLTPLQGMPLEHIHLTPKNISRGLNILREMNSLKTIGIDGNQAWPAAEFWERYDKGEFK